MNSTYDPILEVIESRRASKGARSPEIGVAVVFDRLSGPPMVLWPGQEPKERIGKLRRTYRVDIANRSLSFLDRSPSKDPVFPFSVGIEFGCQVRDPLAVVTDGIRDMTAAVRPSLMSVVRQVTPQFDTLESARAESEITDQLFGQPPMHAVALSSFAVTVTLVDAADIVSAHRENRVHRIRYEAMRPIVDGGRESLLAHDMSLRGGDSSEFLGREQAGMLKALSLLRGDGDLEEINAADLTQHAMNAFFPGRAPKELESEGIRERIARKHRGLDDGKVIDEPPTSRPSDPAGTTDPRPDPSSDGRRASRIRGTASGARHHDES